MCAQSSDKPVVQEHFWADGQVQRAIRKIIKRYGLTRRADAIRLACVLVAEADGPLLTVRQPPATPQVGRPRAQRGR